MFGLKRNCFQDKEILTVYVQQLQKNTLGLIIRQSVGQSKLQNSFTIARINAKSYYLLANKLLKLKGEKFCEIFLSCFICIFACTYVCIYICMQNSFFLLQVSLLLLLIAQLLYRYTNYVCITHCLVTDIFKYCNLHIFSCIFALLYKFYFYIKSIMLRFFRIERFRSNFNNPIFKSIRCYYALTHRVCL